MRAMKADDCRPVTLSNTLSARVSVWLASGLGIGLVTVAPGTIGGLWGILVAWAVGQLPQTGGQVALIVLLALLAVAISASAAKALGGGTDPQAIVLDEIVALPIVYLGFADRSAPLWVAGFLLFRLFDVTKPPPVRQFENLSGAWGIVCDDLAAAVYAWAALHSLVWLDTLLDVGWL
jgi:phosphatidylglycerophosphatase A